MNRDEEYKDSRIESIAEIPRGWERTKLKRLLTTPITDGPHETPVILDEGVPFVSAEAVKNSKIDFDLKRGYISHEEHERFCKKCKPQYGDIFMIKSGATTGNVARVETHEEFSVWSPLALIRVNVDKIFNEYMFQFLQSRTFRLQVELFWNYGTQQNIGMDVLSNLYVVYPTLKVQKRIAIYLVEKTNRIDTLVSDKQKLIDLLKEKRQSIISEAVTKGLDKNAKMKDSGTEWIGEIPDSWNMSKSQWLFSQRKERAYESDEQLTASQSLGIVYQKAYMEQENQRVVQVLKGVDILKHVEENDFVISMRSFQGGIEWSGISGKISSAYVMLIPNYKYVNVHFFKWLFKSRAYITALQSTSNLIRDGQALRYDNFRQIDLPIIPFEEQEMIANYLNKQTAIIDQLIIDIQTQIEKLKEYRQSIISESVTGKTLIIEGQQPVAEKKATANLHFKRRVLAAHILDILCDEPTMGHVKLEKLLFLSEHIAKLDLQTQYDRHAAGPYNPKVLRSIDTQLKKAEWFEYKATSETSNKYNKLPKSDEHETYYERYFDEQQRETVDKLMALFHSARTIQCEIVATLYGAWNDFIIDGIQPSDDKIVDEVLTNWHEKKERIARERWLGALKWMRDNQLIPDGYGTSTKGGRK